MMKLSYFLVFFMFSFFIIIESSDSYEEVITEAVSFTEKLTSRKKSNILDMIDSDSYLFKEKEEYKKNQSVIAKKLNILYNSLNQEYCNLKENFAIKKELENKIHSVLYYLFNIYFYSQDVYLSLTLQVFFSDGPYHFPQRTNYNFYEDPDFENYFKLLEVCEIVKNSILSKDIKNKFYEVLIRKVLYFLVDSTKQPAFGEITLINFVNLEKYFTKLKYRKENYKDYYDIDPNQIMNFNELKKLVKNEDSFVSNVFLPLRDDKAMVLKVFSALLKGLPFIYELDLYERNKKRNPYLVEEKFDKNSFIEKTINFIYFKYLIDSNTTQKNDLIACLENNLFWGLSLM